ncbi:MAG: YfiH family protein [Paraglaciecola sp.]|jgi:YfiH family protein
MKIHQLPSIFKQFSNLIAAESTRHGGISPAPYVSLNLGGNTNDLSKNVEKNRNIFFSNLNISLEQVVFNHQIHGDNILVVTKPGNYSGYDALLSNKQNVFLTTGIADCVPILIYDKENWVCMAIHAGWKGTVKRILVKTLMHAAIEFGTAPKDCYVYIGTCIDECSFEVDADIADEFSDDFKRWDAEKEKFFVDLKKANLKQSLDLGIPEAQIEISPNSTVLHNEDYFSYRKEGGETGRMMVVIGRK